MARSKQTARKGKSTAKIEPELDEAKTAVDPVEKTVAKVDGSIKKKKPKKKSKKRSQ
jgi:hypothetical protein